MFDDHHPQYHSVNPVHLDKKNDKPIRRSSKRDEREIFLFRCYYTNLIKPHDDTSNSPFSSSFDHRTTIFERAKKKKNFCPLKFDAHKQQ